MKTKNKTLISQKKLQSRLELVKAAREAKKERLLRLSGNI